MNRGLFERNARACENAKHPKCTCVCGGALHGVSHAAKMEELWQAYVERAEREREENDPGEQRPDA